MKKLFYVFCLIILSSCIGQNAPFIHEETTVTSVEKINSTLYYSKVSTDVSVHSLSTNNTYIGTRKNNLIVGDTIVIISKRELRELIKK